MLACPSCSQAPHLQGLPLRGDRDESSWCPGGQCKPWDEHRWVVLGRMRAPRIPVQWGMAATGQPGAGSRAWGTCGGALS